MSAGAARRYCGGMLGALALVLGSACVQAADIIKGSQIYAMHCASCHGPSGISVIPGVPNLARAERMLQSDLALLASLKAGKNTMPAYMGILTDQQILDVIAFSRTLRR